MFGDYEAQRHWMEITINTPIAEWYVETSSNNLNYWGLDYPPLTAYGSWICGKIAQVLNPEWVALHTSRGYEDKPSKLFMRSTVWVLDAICYFIPAVYFCFSYRPRNGHMLTFWERFQVLMLLLLQPGLILVDHGHFQYNCVSLGLAIMGIAWVVNDRDLLGSIAFCLSLNYKQMSLYYAPSFFFYLLGKAVYRAVDRDEEIESVSVHTFIVGLGSQKTLMKVIRLGISVIGTFVVLWSPFVFSPSPADSVGSVISRIFPLNRGLFEDKVANFWFAANVAIKLRQIYSVQTLFKLSTVVTAIAFLPSSLALLFRPSKRNFLISLVTSSLSFFLFSFQVHEKSILLTCIPLSLLHISSFGGGKRAMSRYSLLLSYVFLFIATLSMFPLLSKDGQSVQYFGCMVLFSSVVFSVKTAEQFETNTRFYPLCLGVVWGCAVLIHFCSVFISPPSRMPDIYLYLYALYSFCWYVAFFAFYNCCILLLPSCQK